MKNQKLDQLFEKKLKYIARQPSAEAWKRILEQQEAQVKKPIARFYAAASITILLIAGAIVFIKLSGTAPTEIAEQPDDSTRQMVEKKQREDPIDVPSQPSPEIAENDTPQRSLNKQDRLPAIPEEPGREEMGFAETTLPLLQKKELVATVDAPEPAISDEISAEEKSIVSAQDELNDGEEEFTYLPVTIVYKRTPDTPAVRLAKKPNGLERVFLLAQEFGENNLRFSDIRQAKDKLLDISIDFYKSNENSKNSN